MNTFIYLCLILCLIIFILYLLFLNLSNSPPKIKLFFSIITIPLLFKNILLLLSIVIENQALIYLLRYLIFLDFFSIPLLILGTLYIFLRDEKLKFNINYIFLTFISIAYIALLYFNPMDILISKTYGFIVIFQNNLIPSLLYLILIASLTVFNLFFIDKEYSNTYGMKLLLFSQVSTIFDFFLSLGGIKLFPYPIMGELFILVSAIVAINTFKRISK